MEIKGYELAGDMTSRNAGFSRWTFCTKEGHEYFIKEFLSPVYPVDTGALSMKLVNRKRKLCDEFYEHKRAILEVLQRCRTGNNIIARDFFREGSRYYLVTDRVVEAPLPIDKVCLLSEKKKYVIIRSLIYSVAALHEHGFVHADLKPDNLLLKRTPKGYITVKVIDFDGGFLEDDIPREVQGDFVYLAPETLQRLSDNEVHIGREIDAFAMGLLIHLYWCGSLPTFDSRYRYACEAVAAESPLELCADLPEDLAEVVNGLLLKEPSERLDLSETKDILGMGECAEGHLTSGGPTNDTHDDMHVTMVDDSSRYLREAPDDSHASLRGFHIPSELG